MRRPATPRQLTQPKAHAKPVAKVVAAKPIQKPIQKQAAKVAVKPQLKTKMQKILTQHVAKPIQAPKTAAIAKKAAPSRQIRPATPVKATKLVQKAPIARPAVAAKKVLPKYPVGVGLAQVDTQTEAESDQMEDALLNTFNEQSLQSLLQTRDSLHHISEAIGEPKEKKVANLAKSFGVEMDDDIKEQAQRSGSNQLIAHAIADRVLAQLHAGKDKKSLAQDLSKTKESLKLAQKAFYDKDPEAIELLQLDDRAIADENDKIILYDNNSKIVEEGQDERSFVQELADGMDLIGDEN